MIFLKSMFDEVTGSKYYENILIYKLFVYFSQKNNSKEVNVEVDIELLLECLIYLSGCVLFCWIIHN
ncbi:hypothetical protein COD89_00840 [Bacillus thuringiensis]|nr:hypothetical protein CON12_02960 [Bacillus thuringiensis]PGV62490.1 hypothetical protein COD89_00840 [Bacillus thuringiensis]